MTTKNNTSLWQTQLLQAKTLYAYTRNNPGKYEFGSQPSDYKTILSTLVGSQSLCCPVESCDSVCLTDEIAFFIPYLVSDIPLLETYLSNDLGQPITIPPPPSGYPYTYLLAGQFPIVCNATSYSLKLTSAGNTLPTVQYNLGTFTYSGAPPPPYPNGQLGFIICYPLFDIFGPSAFDTATITASNSCSNSAIDVQFGCFLEGAPVTMADGSYKAIQDIVVGDVVKGAFGENNTVLALHRPMLGAGTIVDINKEHKSTKHHPHVSPDFTFYCVEPDIISNLTYGKKHTVINAHGKKEQRIMKGLNKDRIKKLEVGTVLQTGSGPKVVSTLDDIRMSPFTQVYHLVVDGSHTYIVDNYAVSAWPNEDDFNFDTWTSK